MITTSDIRTKQAYNLPNTTQTNSPHDSLNKKNNIQEGISLNISNEAKKIIATQEINKKINTVFSNDKQLDEEETTKEWNTNQNIFSIFHKNRDEATKEELHALFHEHYITMYGEEGIYTEEEEMNDIPEKRHPNGYIPKIATEEEKKYADKIWGRFTDLWEFDKISSKDRAMSYKITKTINEISANDKTTQKEKEKLSVLYNEINSRYEHTDYSKLNKKDIDKLDNLFKDLDELYNLKPVNKESIFLMMDLIDERNNNS